MEEKWKSKLARGKTKMGSVSAGAWVGFGSQKEHLKEVGTFSVHGDNNLSDVKLVKKTHPTKNSRTELTLLVHEYSTF